MPAIGVTIHDWLGVSSVADLLLQVFTKDSNGVEGSLTISLFHLIWDHRPPKLKQAPSHQSCSYHRKISLPFCYIGVRLCLETWAIPHVQMAAVCCEHPNWASRKGNKMSYGVREQRIDTTTRGVQWGCFHHDTKKGHESLHKDNLHTFSWAWRQPSPQAGWFQELCSVTHIWTLTIYLKNFCYPFSLAKIKWSQLSNIFKYLLRTCRFWFLSLDGWERSHSKLPAPPSLWRGWGLWFCCLHSGCWGHPV